MVIQSDNQVPMIDDAYIGSRIRQGRRLMFPEMSQVDLAQAVSTITGVKYSQDQVSRWEHGMSLKPSILQPIRLAQGQPLRFYYGGEGTTEPVAGNNIPVYHVSCKNNQTSSVGPHTNQKESPDLALILSH